MKVFDNVLKYRLRKDSLTFFKKSIEVYYFFDLSINEIGKVKVKNCHWYFDDEKYLKMEDYGKVGYYTNFQLQAELNNQYTRINNNIGAAYDYSNSDGRTHKESLFSLPEEKQLLKEWLPDAIFHVQDQYWVNDTLTDFKLIDSNKGEILWTIPQPLVEKTDAYDGRTNIKKVLGI